MIGTSHVNGLSPAARPHQWPTNGGFSPRLAPSARHRHTALCAAFLSPPPRRAATAATPQRAGEPSWHRRARRRRGEARAWLRVAAASRLLQAHHSSYRCASPSGATMPNGASRGGKGSTGGGGKGGKGGGWGGKGGGPASDSPAWDCHICGLPANFGWRARCRGCDVTRKGKGDNGVAGVTSDKGRDGKTQSLAERQLKQMREEQKRLRLAHEEENKQLRDALARMRAKATGQKEKMPGEDEVDGDADEEMDTAADTYASWTEDERQKKLEEVRGGLAYIIGKHGEDSQEANGIREEMAAIQRASRDAKPFKAHRSLLERKRERLKEKQARDEADEARITSELEELETKRKNLRSAMEERGRQISQVEEELAELVRKALAEGDAAGAAGRNDDVSTTPWSAQAASATLRAMASKPGVPPEFAALLAHVFQAAQAMAEATAAACPTAGASPAEGGGNRNHRGNQQQQQQPQQQKQPQSPAAAAEPGAGQGTSAGNAVVGEGGKGSFSSAAIPPLAPQGRWAKGAANAKTDCGNGTNDGDMQVDAVGADDDETAADHRGNLDENEAELVEEEALGSGIDEGVSESINKLPMADQAKLRAALGARGGRRRAKEGNQETGASGIRDRERSPRPTKGGGGQNDAQA